MADIDNTKMKVQCVHCGKMISKKNISTHRKKFHSENDQPTYADLQDALNGAQQTIVAKDHKIAQQDQELQVHKEEIARYKDEVSRLSTLVTTGQCGTVVNQVINNTTNNNINLNVNYYYVLDDEGMRKGLDLTKIRTFGTENVDYIDKTKPLPTIVKEIYCNSAHPENRVISHNYLNLQWVMFRFKDHVLSLNLEHDREKVGVMQKMVCDNVEKLLDQKFDNVEERMHAGRELLQAMDNDVRDIEKRIGVKKASEMIPIWNKDQLKNVEDRIWKQYCDDANYSQNVVR